MAQSKSGSSLLEQNLIRSYELQCDYLSKETELLKAQREIEHMIEGLPRLERMCLRYRYIQCLSWEQVCVQMNYSWRQVHNIHSRALQMLADS